jgi:hypothetical protein
MTQPTNEARAEIATDWDNRIIAAVSVALKGSIGEQNDVERLLKQVTPTEPAEREKVLAEIAIAFIRWAQDLKRQRDDALTPSPAAADAGDAQRVVEALEKVESHFAERMRDYSLGDRPPSPPAWMLMAMNDGQTALAAARRLLDAPPGVGERMREALREAIDALEPFTFPAHPNDFQGDDGKMSDALICDEQVQKARKVVANFAAALAAPAPAECARAKAGETLTISGFALDSLLQTFRWLRLIKTDGEGIRKIKEGAVRISVGPDAYKLALAPAASSAAAGGVATGEGGE